MKMPRAGDLRKLITIKSWLSQPNASAGLDENYTGPINVWAKVEPVGSAIYHGTAQTDNAVTHRFYIRYDSQVEGLTGDYVIEHGGRRYRIKRISDLEFKQKFLIIEAEELGAV